MPIIKTAGVVVKAYNYAEADRMLVVFSEKLGKIRLKARGVRKIKSKQAGMLEIPTLANFQLHFREGRDLYLMTGVKASELYRRLRGDLDRWLTACYCLELVNELSAENDAQPRLWALIVDTLRALEDGLSLKLIARGFEQKILDLSGYSLETTGCVSCGRELSGEDYGFDPLQGGVLCRNCSRKRGGSRLALHSDSLEAMKMLREQPALGYGEELGTRQNAELTAISRIYVEYIIEKELKSPVVMKDMRAGRKKQAVADSA